jgi:hypothetical protein
MATAEQLLGHENRLSTCEALTINSSRRTRLALCRLPDPLQARGIVSAGYDQQADDNLRTSVPVESCQVIFFKVIHFASEAFSSAEDRTLGQDMMVLEMKWHMDT